MFNEVIVWQKKSDAISRFHPWIFSGAIKIAKAQEAEPVNVFDERGTFLAFGYYSMGSIAVRILSFKKVHSLEELWQEKIKDAIVLRQSLGFLENEKTTVFRLLNAEGDGVPGLVIDYYNGHCVLQAHSHFIYSQRNKIAEILKKELGEKCVSVYDKSAESLKSKTIKNQSIIGEGTKTIVSENGYQFEIDWQVGQKTGFFIDQRENRKLLQQYASNRKVLNTFAYTGGFSVYALGAAAEIVHSVDSSVKAIALTDANVKLNFPENSRHQSFVMDTFDFFKQSETDFYDLIILDPPAFSKGIGARHQAIQAYKRLNKVAIEKLKKGGILFTFSCSQSVSPAFFEGAVMAAAIECGREAKILHYLRQSADHPVSIFHPEGLYLKGLVLAIN